MLVDPRHADRALPALVIARVPLGLLPLRLLLLALLLLGLLLLALLLLGGGSLSAQSLGPTIDGFVRADCNADGLWDISDPIGLLGWLLSGASAPGCADACDVNDDGGLDIADAVFSLSSLFGAGSPPPSPYPNCGLDPTADDFICEHPPCPIAPIDVERAVVCRTARVGLPYSSELPNSAVPQVVATTTPPEVVQAGIDYLAYGLPADGRLPDGLSLDGVTGVISGTLAEPGFRTFVLWAADALGRVHRLHVDLAVFSAEESEIVEGQDFTLPGPFAVTVLSDSFIHTHELPWPVPYPLWSCTPGMPPAPSVDQLKQVRIHLPVGLPGPAPVVLFHHGTGFDHTQYDEVLGHLASHGFVAVSVDDPFSFAQFPVYYCWGGHEEAARVLVALRDEIAVRSADEEHALWGTIDFDRVFYAGHSRGAACAIIASELDPDIRGVIALQPTDARGDSFIGGTDRWNVLPDVPILDISAEQDLDVAFPGAERLFERFTGPTTMATIYGGCHGLTTDDSDNGCGICTWNPVGGAVDLCPYIERELQIRLTRQLCVAFLRRHGLGDLSVEGQLYGSEWIGSPYLSLASHRALAGTTWVDTFDEFPAGGTGGTWSWFGSGIVGVGSCYDAPSATPVPIPPVTNLVVQVNTGGTMEVGTTFGPVGTGLDVSMHRDLVFRLKNHDRWQLLDNFGFDWLEASVALTDLDGDSVTLPLDDFLLQVEFHPEPSANSPIVTLKGQRYCDVRMPLSRFRITNPALDLDELVSLEWTFTIVPTPSLNVGPQIGIDDLRFE